MIGNEVLRDEVGAGEMGIGERGARRRNLLIYRFWGKTNPRSSCVYVSHVRQSAVSDQCAPGLGFKFL